MNPLPELSDDAVIELAREGGLAFIPKLAGLRRIALAQLADPQREHVCNILRKALAQGEPPGPACPAGRGDQRYYRIQISYVTRQESGDIIMLISENAAPPELERLWRDGE
ncbi:protealysin inhibitor emfourin [Erwinia sp. V71]|uniref:protealysin inhibitor emfourin n=1 Tax=Erwinia sp. V71 TaxID=3369424 RepID=UPI003F62945E